MKTEKGVIIIWNISEKDFNRLTEICGFSQEDIERLRTSFSKTGILKEEEKSNRNIWFL